MHCREQATGGRLPFVVSKVRARPQAGHGLAGNQWPRLERTHKRLASRLPGLEIVTQALVERENGGWRITEKAEQL